MAGTRTTYDGLLAALERFPAQREAVLRWAAETHTAPGDDIWEYVSAAFLAGGLTAERVEAAVRALPAQVDALLKKRPPVAAAAPPARAEHWTTYIVPIAIAIALFAAAEFGAWNAGRLQGYSAGYAAGITAHSHHS